MGYCITRKLNEAVVIDGKTTVTVTELSAGRVKLVFDAPDDVSLERAEKPRTIRIPETPMARFMRQKAS